MFDGEREILERTFIHNWMKQWLKLSGVPGITLSLYRLTRVSQTYCLPLSVQLPGRGLPKIFNSFGMAKSGNAMIWVQDLVAFRYFRLT